MIADLIKENTHKHHQALEAAMIRKIKAIQQPEDYVALLNVFYSYFGGLEHKIKKVIGDALPDLEKRRKAGELANDIKHFGSTPPALATGGDLPEIEQPHHAMAALYVIEGSTLGGIYISKMIAKQLELKTTEGLGFFEGYGEQTMAMWEEFKEIFNAQPKNDAEAEEMVATANDTFLKFKQYMDKY